MNNKYTGALIDERPDSEKARDFVHDEVAAAAAPQLREIHSISDIPFYELRDQDGSSTCMNQAYAKMRGITIAQRVQQYAPLSGGFAYRRRYNKPQPGMALHDILKLGKEHGLPFELIDPSQNMTEEQIENARELPYTDEIAEVITDPRERYFYVEHNFDAIADVILQGYPVLVMIFANRNEYQIIPQIKQADLNPVTASIRHGICAHDAFIYKGKEYILIDDSWGILNSDADDELERELKKRGQRLFSREWVNKRVYGAGYIRDLNFEEGGDDRPRHTFDCDLEYVPNYTEDPEVVALQNVLKYEGVFARDIASSGWYGPYTVSAVGAFQLKHGVVDSKQSPGYGRTGPLTRSKLNELYGA